MSVQAGRPPAALGRSVLEEGDEDLLDGQPRIRVTAGFRPGAEKRRGALPAVMPLLSVLEGERLTREGASGTALSCIVYSFMFLDELQGDGQLRIRVSVCVAQYRG